MTEGNEAGVLDTLAERCEQAMGPDRELDGEIAKALSPDREWHRFEDAWGARCIEDGAAFDMPDEYTRSLDAAMTLAPNLIGVELSLDQNDRWHCELSTSDLDGDGEARAATKELAFVAAALRARTQPPPLSDEGD
jgi:hypothetical protein